MKTKILFVFLIAIFLSFSIFKGNYVGSYMVNFNNFVVNLFSKFATNIENKIEEHFFQAANIKKLQQENLILRERAFLFDNAVSELNQILKDKNSTIYSTKISLIRALSYMNISDYNKIWLDTWKDYNASKIYGLIHQGKSAGIVVGKNDKPLAYLQTDPKSVFSVYIGNDKIQGVAQGNTNNIIVKFISKWLNPKIDDEVYTSGLDGIFFSNLPVGKVIKILDENSYKSVIVSPYAKINIPSYMYVITKQ